MSARNLEIEVAEAMKPLLEPARYKGAYGGRGGTKSHFYAEQLILTCYTKETRCVCIREVQLSLKESVKQLLVDKITKFGLEEFFKITDAEIRGLNGSLIIFRGMQSFSAESIKSLEGFDIAWIEEAQSLSPLSLRLLRPTIRKPGSEIWASWNPRSKRDPIDKLLRGKKPPDNSIVVAVGWEDNPWLPDVLREEKDFDYEVDPEMADHVWGGNYQSVTEGAYYAKILFKSEKEGRITNVPHDPTEQVYTAWDLGLDDDMVVWFFQLIGPAIHVIDYYACRNEALLDVVKLVLEKPYIYAEHYMPHDIKVREQTTGKSRKQSCEKAGLKPIIEGAALPVEDGINAVKNILPKCYFDREKCEDGLESLRNYKTKYDEVNDVMKRLHDWSSHAADGFREFAVNVFNLKDRQKGSSNSEVNYDPFNYGNEPKQETSGVEDYSPW